MLFIDLYMQYATLSDKKVIHIDAENIYIFILKILQKVLIAAVFKNYLKFINSKFYTIYVSFRKTILQIAKISIDTINFLEKS